LHLLSDLEVESFDATAIRLAVFLNAFAVRQRTVVAIKEKLMQRNTTLLFIHAAGFVNGDTAALDVVGIANLTGLPIRRGGGATSLTTKIVSPSVAGFVPGDTFGMGEGSAAVSPWFFAEATEDPTVRTLGVYINAAHEIEQKQRRNSTSSRVGGSRNVTSFAAKQFANHRVVWSGSPAGGPAFFRAVARECSGLHLFSNVSTDVVEANGNTLMLFTTVFAGPRKILLHTAVAEVVAVTETGETVVCTTCTGFEVTLADRRVFLWRWK
jgi:hypothetical protein